MTHLTEWKGWQGSFQQECGQGQNLKKNNSLLPTPHPAKKPHKNRSKLTHLRLCEVPTPSSSLCFSAASLPGTHFSFYWAQHGMTVDLSPLLLPSLNSLNTLRVQSDLCPQFFCLVHSEYLRKVAKLNLNKNLVLRTGKAQWYGP
jgi:hypothetical protein